jgi:two-component system cell cycle response regulator
MATAPHRRRTDGATAGGSPLRALVVEDHEAYRDYLTGLIGRFGFIVTAVSDGPEALRRLREEPRYHLLVVDHEMPGMSGLALMTAVRAHERFHDLYALMLTGRDDPETKINALGAGFDDFLSKSAGEEVIAAKLSAARRLISHHQHLHDTIHELYGMATRDELTGVFNRRFFFAEADHLLRESAVVSVVFFDFDDFKRINDTFGHLAGDRILRDIGSVFLRHTRTEDLIARYGGDEFVMLVTALEPADVEMLAARVSEEIAALQWTFATETVTLTVTTGLAFSSLLDHPTIAQLLSAGDRDLYKNKWTRSHPSEDASLYEYEDHNGSVVDLSSESGQQRVRK